MANEGVLKLVLAVSQLDGGVPVISESVCIRNFPWRLMVLHSQDSVRNSQGGKGRTFGVFVQCVPESPGSLNWTAPAHVNVKVKNHNNEEKCVAKVFDHKYSNSSSDWGYNPFMKWKDLTDPAKGFIKDEKIYLEAKIQLKNDSAAAVPPAIGLGAADPFFSCPDCKESFESKGERQPMSLKCGHTFCSVCLQKALTKSGEKSSLKCSTCKQLHSCETGTGAGLWFPNHTMVQIIANLASKSKFFCSIHQHDTNYYCFDDHSVVCIYCAYHGEHSTHNCKHMEEAKKEAAVALRKVKLSVSSHVSEMERRLQFVKDEREVLKSQEASIRQVIEDSYEQLKGVLLRQRELLFQELGDQTADFSSGIDSSAKKMDDQYSKVKAVLSEYTAWNGLSCRDALGKYSTMQSRLSSIPSMCSVLSVPEPCPKMSFQMSGLSDMLSFGHLGKIVVIEEAEEVTEKSTDEGRTGHAGDLPPTKKRKNQCPQTD